MPARLFKHYRLVLMAVTLMGVLSTARADANPVSYNGRSSGGDEGSLVWLMDDVPFSGTIIFQPANMVVLPLHSAGKMDTVKLAPLPIMNGRRSSQEVYLSGAVEGLYLNSAAGYGANPSVPLEIAAATSSGTIWTPSDSRKDFTVLSALLQELLLGLVQAKGAASSLSRAVPRPGALILLGSGLLALAFGIRRITTRKDSDHESDAEVPKLSIDAEVELDYRETGVVGSAAPLFPQRTSTQADSIPLSQHS